MHFQHTIAVGLAGFYFTNFLEASLGQYLYISRHGNQNPNWVKRGKVACLIDLSLFLKPTVGNMVLHYEHALYCKVRLTTVNSPQMLAEITRSRGVVGVLISVISWELEGLTLD